MSDELVPFTIDVPEGALDELRQRLTRARWPEPATVGDWSQGVPVDWLRALCGYWAQQYDWRRLEARSRGPRTISARYLRSGRWVPLRIGSLSLKGAALMAVALPRVNDRVDVALAYAQHRALVRGAVQKVSTMREAETSGATMFSVSFELDDGSRRQLTALLTAARAANVTIKPAPPRGTRRYPVEWPVCLGTSRGAVRAEAFDVS